MARIRGAHKRIGSNDKHGSFGFRRLIALITGLAFFATLMATAPANATDDTTTTGDQVCQGLDSGKIDTTGNPKTVTLTAPEGKFIDGYCVKAGSTEQGNGPVYVTVSPPVKTLTISYPGGKDISHYSVSYTDAPPPDKVVYGEWVDGSKDCESKTVTQTRTKSVTTYKWVDGKWVAQTPVVTTETQTRPMTPAEIQACTPPPPPPVVDVCPGMPGNQPTGTVCMPPPPPPVDVCPNMTGNQPVGTVCVTPEPATKNKGSIYGSCVTPARGEGVAKGRVTNAHSTRVTVKQNGQVVKTRVVAAGARFRMEMSNLQVGKTVKLYMGGKLVDRDMVENDCVLPPHVGLKTAAATQG